MCDFYVVLTLGWWCHTPLPHAPGSSGDILTKIINDLFTWGRGCGGFPHFLVSWFETNGDSLLDPGMAALVVEVEEEEGEKEEGEHQCEGSHWEKH